MLALGIIAALAIFALKTRNQRRASCPVADFNARHVSADPRHRWPTPALFPLADAMACWRQVRAPTLSLYGNDAVLPGSGRIDAASLAARQACFSDLRAQHLEDCGHNLHHDRPDAVAAQLKTFFMP